MNKALLFYLNYLRTVLNNEKNECKAIIKAAVNEALTDIAKTAIAKGWITTEDGQHLFLGGDGSISGGKAAYEASKGNSGENSNSGSKTPDTKNSDDNKTIAEKYGAPKEFTSGEDAKDYFGTDWQKSLSNEQVDAIKAYTNGDMYRQINTALRNGAEPTEDVAKNIELLESAINKSTLSEPITVYRRSNAELFFGDNNFYTAKDIKDLVGTVVIDKGFTSSSATEKGAKDSSDTGMRLKITVPPGIGRGAYVQEFSDYKHEQEYLLNHGTKFKVVKADPFGEIELEVID